jgi:hypothetical protein
MSAAIKHDAGSDLRCYESPKRVKTFGHCNNGYEPLDIIDITWDGMMPNLSSPVMHGNSDVTCKGAILNFPSTTVPRGSDVTCKGAILNFPSTTMPRGSDVTCKEPIRNFPPPVLYQSIDLTCNESMPTLPPLVGRGLVGVTCKQSTPSPPSPMIYGSVDLTSHQFLPNRLDSFVYMLDMRPKTNIMKRDCFKREAGVLSDWGFYLGDTEVDIVTGDFEVDSFSEYTLQRFGEIYPRLCSNRMVVKACLLIACKVIGDKNLPAMDPADERSTFVRIASIPDGSEIVSETDGTLAPGVRALLVFTEALVLNTLKFSLQIDEFYESSGIDRQFS